MTAVYRDNKVCFAVILHFQTFLFCIIQYQHPVINFHEIFHLHITFSHHIFTSNVRITETSQSSLTISVRLQFCGITNTFAQLLMRRVGVTIRQTRQLLRAHGKREGECKNGQTGMICFGERGDLLKKMLIC